MSLINRDSDEKAKPSEYLEEFAKTFGMFTLHVHCTGDSKKVELSFWCAVHALPRVGDPIVLEDGGVCKVETVFHKVATKRDNDGKAIGICLFPTVLAKKVLD